MTSALDIITSIQGLTPNLPCSHPFVAAWSSGAFFLAQATPDISGVPADYVKNFFIMLAFVAALGGGVMWGRRGSQASPVHIKQPVAVDAMVSKAPVHAHQSAVDELRQRMASLEEANMREHKSHREALAASFGELLEKGSARELRILTGQHEMETRMMTAILGGLQDFQEKMGPLGERVAGHAKAIQAIKDDLNRLWELVKPFLGLGCKTKTK